MKKSIIVAGAASVALAAMPIVGAFAAVEGVRDVVNATVGAGCSILNNSGDATATNTVSIAATADEVSTSSVSDSGYAGISVVCNSSDWAISAVGSGTGSKKTSLYSGANEIETGTATSGEDSAWAFRIANISVSDGVSAGTYADFSEIPDVATAVVTGTKSAAVTVKPQYQIFVAADQAAGTYTGAVTYTVAAN